MIGLFYMAAVGCPNVGSHKAEVLADALMRRAITLGVSSAAKTVEFMNTRLFKFEEIIPGKYCLQGRLLVDRYLGVWVKDVYFCCC